MEKHFRITWEIDVFGDSDMTHEDAARDALRTMRNPHSSAVVFNVTEVDANCRLMVDDSRVVDLLETEADA